MQNSRVESLASIENFLKNSKEEFVVLSDCDTVCNIDYTDVLAYHLDKEADVTIIYRYGSIPQGLSHPSVYTVDPAVSYTHLDVYKRQSLHGAFPPASEGEKLSEASGGNSGERNMGPDGCQNDEGYPGRNEGTPDLRYSGDDQVSPEGRRQAWYGKACRRAFGKIRL